MSRKRDVAADVLEVFTERDLANRLKVSERMIRKMRATGRLPAPVKFGRSVRWRRADLESWMADLPTT